LRKVEDEAVLELAMEDVVGVRMRFPGPPPPAAFWARAAWTRRAEEA
jgi:hypothetical protein